MIRHNLHKKTRELLKMKKWVRPRESLKISVHFWFSPSSSSLSKTLMTSYVSPLWLSTQSPPFFIGNLSKLHSAASTTWIVSKDRNLSVASVTPRIQKHTETFRKPRELNDLFLWECLPAPWNHPNVRLRKKIWQWSQFFGKERQ